MDWESCEKYDVVKQSMKSWVVKKFVEYLGTYCMISQIFKYIATNILCSIIMRCVLLGEEEPSLTNFILTKLAKRCHPEELLSKYDRYNST